MKRIILAGGSGLLGRALARHFTAAGWETVILRRALSAKHTGAREVLWDARSFSQWAREIEGADALVNLTGRTVDCRYTSKNRHDIMQSRVESTRVIGQAVALCDQAPSVWLNASTATIYKHTYGPAWTENGEMGATPRAKDSFSVEVARAWEEELNRAETPRTRKIHTESGSRVRPS
jgi:uncharacterized protein